MPGRIDTHYWREARFERREGWDDGRHPFDLPVLRGLDALPFHPKVTFLVGENGSGKSALVEALAVAWGFNAEGGSRNFSFASRADIWRAGEHGLERTAYEDTDAYQTTRAFLLHRESMLRTLLED